MKARHIILLTAMAVELFLMVYCLIRKSNHTPQGYLCAALSLVLLIMTGWLLLFPKMTPVATTGPYKVLKEDSFYTDESREETYADNGSKRELPVSFWYPEDYDKLQRCPLVVFSHGSFGLRTSNETLYRELASHGYVVCSIDHTYQCISTKLSNGKTIRVSFDYVKELQADEPQKNPEQSVEHFKKWMHLRTTDINFVLDTILANVTSGSKDLASYALIDSTRIGLIGHSLGGSAVLGVGRQRDDISAVIALEAPFMCDIQGVDADGNFIFEESPYPVPVLNVYSDSAWNHLKEWKQYAENVKLLDMESDTVKNVHLSGIGHIGLTDLSITSPFLTSVFDGKTPKKAPQKSLKEINEICLPFLDANLASQSE